MRPQGREKTGMFKKDRKTVIVLLMALILSMVSGLSAATDGVDQGETEYAKNETIYVNLAGDGRVAEINVVNAFTGTNGEIVDYGTYESITNLTSSEDPVLDGDKITIYYGASDEVICGAELSIKEILQSLK